jgi:hypothetical protein
MERSREAVWTRVKKQQRSNVDNEGEEWPNKLGNAYVLGSQS